MPDDSLPPSCECCGRKSRWAIANFEGDDMQPIMRWFACSKHLGAVLTGAPWEVDCVQVYDFHRPSGGA